MRQQIVHKNFTEISQMSQNPGISDLQGVADGFAVEGIPDI